MCTLGGIPAKRFYPPTGFTAPVLRATKARRVALSAARNDPSRTFRVFPQQHLACSFCDAHPAQALRLWAVEKDNKGRRGFIVASYPGFWHVYKKYIMRELDMHFYEVIREGYACRLYFDLEFLKAWNEGKDGEMMVEKLVEVVRGMLKGTMKRGNGDGIVELDSTSDKKFSRHLIFEHVAFYDNIEAGEFARRAVERVVDLDAKMMMVKKGEGEEMVPFVDLGVYTKNRCFRLIGSSKFGKMERLVAVKKDKTEARSRVCVSREEFMRSLVCYVGEGVELLGNVSPRDNQMGGASRNLLSGANAKGLGVVISRDASSAFPKLDLYVVSIIRKDGGRVHGVTVLGESGFVMYGIKGGYKYCGNVGRHHKSNNVILVADVGKGVMFQRCFDADCRGYRSPEWRMPVGVVGDDGDSEGFIDESLSDDCLNGLMEEMETSGRVLRDEEKEDDALNRLMDQIEGVGGVIGQK